MNPPTPRTSGGVGTLVNNKNPVLNYGCFWAAGESTSTGANNALAQTLWTLGAYNDGVPAYVRNMTGSGETFHLKSFLADPDCPKGECEDFADFLVCLSTSVGASEMKAQRSNVLPYGARFWHKSLTPAGKPGPEVGRFWYHQFGIIGTSVWDGCISITGWDVPKNWTRETTYRPRLVDFYTIGTWDPTPGSGFTPAITTNPLP